MNILVITNLFPSAQEPNRGKFVFQETKALAEKANIAIIAPLPWTPKFGNTAKWSSMINVPAYENIDGFNVYHPRYFVIPKFFRFLYGFFFMLGIKKIFQKLIAERNIEFVISHYAYPDGYGTQKLTSKNDLPHIIKVRGSDLNVFTKNYLRRKLTVSALKQADLLVTVSEALRQKAISLGIAPDHVATVRNGIDPTKFSRIDKNQARSMLGWDDLKYILYIGHLIELKGIWILLNAFKKLININELPVKLIIAGEGILKKEISVYLKKHDLDEKVFLLGEVPHQDIATLLSAVDVLCLPSYHEGCPNVIVEGAAIGTNIVASEVGGIPELLEDYLNSTLVRPGDDTELAEALRLQLENTTKRQVSRSRTWEMVANDMLDIINKVSNKNKVN